MEAAWSGLLPLHVLSGELRWGDNDSADQICFVVLMANAHAYAQRVTTSVCRFQACYTNPTLQDCVQRSRNSLG